MSAYYNEIDEYAAQWLRNLIAAGHIAPGDVDTRSIEDVAPDDLKQYTQCHFFAGIGVWSLALRRAGWPDDREVWTGSCPCQPFSVAGKGNGFNDERHLWPAFHWLIEQRRPNVVFGEQVASKDGYVWLDLVQADLEGSNYTVGAIVAPAAGFGAPHIRSRMYWVADTYQEQRGRQPDSELHAYRQTTGREQGYGITQPDSEAGGMADADDEGSQGRVGMSECADERFAGSGGVVGGMADTTNERQHGRGSSEEGNGGSPARVEPERLCATRGFWSAADWIYCRDEKYRPVEPGTFPLAHGATSRVGRLRAYGNAICAPQAEEFIKAYLGVRP
jgi:DNA (cytosine-5)-methyltransferase 1